MSNGEPDRKFRLLGIIDQNNVLDSSSPLSVLANVTAESSLVAEAKKNGGDAIIFISQNSQLLGARNSVDYSGYHSNPLTSSTAKVAVIKYLNKTVDKKKESKPFNP